MTRTRLTAFYLVISHMIVDSQETLFKVRISE